MISCPACARDAPDGSRFCPACGAPLAVMPAEPAAGAERRQVTVLFCDLVGSTALSFELDPEDWREVLRSYQSAAVEVVERFDGHVAQFLGDGILVYFGYPQAHEEDARRAVHTGLGILEAVAGLRQRLLHEHGIELTVRMGVHTGDVVAGEMGSGSRREYLATGPTPNVAARLQGHARPGTLLVSRATYELVRGFFVCKGLGRPMLKGVAPLEVYQVEGESGVDSRFELAVARGLTPMVGRESELARVLASIDDVREGRGRAVVITGEAGIGKSRLVYQLKHELAAAPFAWRICRCSPYHQQSAFHPIIEMLREILQIEREDPPESRLEKLRRRLDLFGVRDPETVALLAAFLSLPTNGYRLPELDPQERKEKTVALLVTMLLKLTELDPVILVCEDLHWVDPSTLALLDLLMRRVASARLLILMTSRPSWRSPWDALPYVTSLTLGRLSEQEVRSMVGRLTSAKPLPGGVLSQVWGRTDGVPLAVEELLKMLLESKLLVEGEERYELAGPLPRLAIPATLRDSLMARLDHLEAYRELAQMAAVLGREFSYELIQAASPMAGASLREGLARLVEADLLLEIRRPARTTYVFKHALIQDVAYQSLLKSTRRHFHGRIAEALIEQFPETARALPELVAHHCAQAGRSQLAVDYWLEAGQRAVERFANPEAIDHLTNGLAVLATLPRTPARDQQELQYQLALGPTLMATRGFAAPEVGQALRRARELSQQRGDRFQLFSILRGLWQFHLVRGELRTAFELAEELLKLAESAPDAALIPEARRVAGETAMFRGELKAARTHLEQGIRTYDADAFHPAEDPAAVCNSYLAWTLWLLGYPDQAREKIREGLAHATALSHPFTLAVTHYFVAVFHQHLREVEIVQEQAEAMMTVAAEHNFALLMLSGSILRGWALIEKGLADEGIAQIREGLASCRAMTKLFQPYWLGLLAGVLVKAGRLEEAQAALEEARETADETGERWWSAELERVTGELLLERSPENAEAAESCFRRAIDRARRQRAKSWELRAVTSLAGLLRRQGRHPEARRMLALVYDELSEGLETADLRQARTLLDALAADAPAPGSELGFGVGVFDRIA